MNKLTINIAKLVRWLQLQRILPSLRTLLNMQPSCDQFPRVKFQYEHKVLFVSPRAILCRAILTGLLKFLTDNPLMLPAMTKLFKRLDVFLVSSKDTLKKLVFLYNTKMTVCCLELFVIVDSLNIVRGMLIEDDEACGTLSLNSVKLSLILNGDLREFLTIPENVSPLKFCGCTASKLRS